MVIVERGIRCIVEKWSKGYRGNYYQPAEPPEPEDFYFEWDDTGDRLTKAEADFFEKECTEAYETVEPEAPDFD